MREDLSKKVAELMAKRAEQDAEIYKRNEAAIAAAGGLANLVFPPRIEDCPMDRDEVSKRVAEMKERRDEDDARRYYSSAPASPKK